MTLHYDKIKFKIFSHSTHGFELNNEISNFKKIVDCYLLQLTRYQNMPFSFKLKRSCKNNNTKYGFYMAYLLYKIQPKIIPTTKLQNS